jgi:hypothetical protein
LIFDLLPPAQGAFICYIMYLSLRELCGPFTALQWDSLLLEAGLLAALLGPVQFAPLEALKFDDTYWPSPIVRVFSAFGVVQLCSCRP